MARVPLQPCLPGEYFTPEARSLCARVKNKSELSDEEILLLAITAAQAALARYWHPGEPSAEEHDAGPHCPQCWQVLHLVGIEPAEHDERDEVLTFECQSCDAFNTIVVPKQRALARNVRDHRRPSH